MVRPRLVEEGAPLYGPGSDQPSRRVVLEDHDMEDHDHHAQHHEAKPMSSLQLAALSSGTKIPSPKRKSETYSTASYVVGGGSIYSDNHPATFYSSLPSRDQAHIPQYHYHHSMQQNHIESGKHDVTNSMEFEVAQISNSHSYCHKDLGRHVPLPQRHLQSPPMHHYTPEIHFSTLPLVQTSCTIGEPSGPIEKMVGVEDHGHKSPLVVLDGANVAHAYGMAVAGLYSKKGGGSDPDATGIQVAVDYFQSAGVRVLVVLPQYWFRSKPRPGENSTQWLQQEVLTALQAKGLIVASPPADDDDAYALTIARREESRSLRRHGEGPGFVLSNDMFRDAQGRDTTDALKQWLNSGRNDATGPGRISYSFADMGTMNDHGERILDFVPNPRHPLVIWIEGMSLQGGVMP